MQEDKEEVNEKLYGLEWIKWFALRVLISLLLGALIAAAYQGNWGADYFFVLH